MTINKALGELTKTHPSITHHSIKYKHANMEKDQIVILKDRGLISVEGINATDFLQNIISNDIKLVDNSNSI